jgi:hypothetical protein
VEAALSLFALALAGAGTPDARELVRQDLERWPTAEVATYRLDFADARRAYLLRRLSWDVLHGDLLCGQVRKLDHARAAWRQVQGARWHWAAGFADGTALYLEELRRLLGERDYAAGRLPPLPDVGEFGEITP